VVENNANDALLIRRALLTRGLCGLSAVCRNGSEARAYLLGAGMYADRATYPMPNVILTDLLMDGETGTDLVEWIRAQEPPLCDLPVIILTGSANPAQFEAAKKVGANKVLEKPARLEDLQALFEEMAVEFCGHRSAAAH